MQTLRAGDGRNMMHGSPQFSERSRSVQCDVDLLEPGKVLLKISSKGQNDHS